MPGPAGLGAKLTSKPNPVVRSFVLGSAAPIQTLSTLPPLELVSAQNPVNKCGPGYLYTQLTTALKGLSGRLTATIDGADKSLISDRPPKSPALFDRFG